MWKLLVLATLAAVALAEDSGSGSEDPIGKHLGSGITGSTSSGDESTVEPTTRNIISGDDETTTAGADLPVVEATTDEPLIRDDATTTTDGPEVLDTDEVSVIEMTVTADGICTAFAALSDADTSSFYAQLKGEFVESTAIGVLKYVSASCDEPPALNARQRRALETLTITYVPIDGTSLAAANGLANLLSESVNAGTFVVSIGGIIVDQSTVVLVTGAAAPEGKFGDPPQCSTCLCGGSQGKGKKDRTGKNGGKGKKRRRRAAAGSGSGSDLAHKLTDDAVGKAGTGSKGTGKGSKAPKGPKAPKAPTGGTKTGKGSKGSKGGKAGKEGKAGWVNPVVPVVPGVPIVPVAPFDCSVCSACNTVVSYGGKGGKKDKGGKKNKGGKKDKGGKVKHGKFTAGDAEMAASATSPAVPFVGASALGVLAAVYVIQRRRRMRAPYGVLAAGELIEAPMVVPEEATELSGLIGPQHIHV